MDQHGLRPVENPSELLMSDEMDVFIEKLKETYDIIVLYRQKKAWEN